MAVDRKDFMHHDFAKVISVCSKYVSFDKYYHGFTIVNIVIMLV